jgi:hypothetical protein
MGQKLSEAFSERISALEEKTPTHRHYWLCIVPGPDTAQSPKMNKLNQITDKCSAVPLYSAHVGVIKHLGCCHGARRRHAQVRVMRQIAPIFTIDVRQSRDSPDSEGSLPLTLLQG